MTRHSEVCHPAARILVLGALAFVGLGPPAVARQDPDLETGLPQGAEALTRGPVHEAFAEPVVFDPQPGVVITRQPPQAVEEVPPDQRPEGDNVQWIPGYWAWDDDRNDFLWISGIWRIPPPGRQWVPGYWNQVDRGFQWVPGTWVPIAAQGPGPDDEPIQAQQYLPAPPQSLEAGPNVPAPQVEAVWAPGTWYWQQTRYAWRPGYWVMPQPNWIWIPAHYVWTPSGYLFVDGYWDYQLANRGCLFAPVYFSQPIYTQRSFVYTPTISLLAGGLVANLFVRPSCGQYYFGDYYAANNFRSGIYPWYSFHGSRYGYDPIYANAYAVNMRRDPRWADNLHEAYRYRRDHVDARPPHTFVQQSQVINSNNTTIVNNITNVTTVNNVRNVALAAPVSRVATQLAAAPGNHVRFTRVNEADRRAAVQQGTQLREFRQTRLRQEGEASRRPGGGIPQQPRRFDLPQSPIAGSAPGRGAGRDRVQAADAARAALGGGPRREQGAGPDRAQAADAARAALGGGGLRRDQMEAAKAAQAERQRERNQAAQAERQREEAAKAAQVGQQRERIEAAKAAQADRQRAAEAARAANRANNVNPPPNPARPRFDPGAQPPGAGQMPQRHDPHPDNRPPQPHQVRPPQQPRPGNGNGNGGNRPGRNQANLIAPGMPANTTSAAAPNPFAAGRGGDRPQLGAAARERLRAGQPAVAPATPPPAPTPAAPPQPGPRRERPKGERQKDAQGGQGRPGRGSNA